MKRKMRIRTRERRKRIYLYLKHRRYILFYYFPLLFEVLKKNVEDDEDAFGKIELK